MYQVIQKNRKFIAPIAACLIIGAITMSFQNIPFGPLDRLDSLTGTQDTVPERATSGDATMSIKDFDNLMKNMDNEAIKLHKEMANIDFNKIHNEINASLNKVDFDKISVSIEKALRQIDIAKIENSITAALNEINRDAVNDDLKVSLQNAKKEIEKVKLTEVKKELEKAKLEIEESRKEIKKINVDEIIKNANTGINKAKDELRLKKEMFNAMEKDGLISQKDGFTIEYKNKTLFINGITQNEKISTKYQPFIKGESFKISIRKE